MQEEALAQISSLVERFECNIEAYRSPVYNETQLRREFIDPFFEALGWDIANKAGYAEQYKDVVHEDAIKVAGATKAPDYCFRVGGVRKFFLETKKPSVDIRDQSSPAYQLRRYAWSAKLPLSILTDFEEIAIYDCRLRPKPNDKPSVGRIRLYNYKQYLDSFEEIYNLLAKESVLKGSFDKFAESEKQKRGTTEVDAEFLKEIESWRDSLAKNIAIKNPKLSIRELNFAVQLTIDRIIFLRMCEDRGIESYGQIQSLQNGTNVFSRLRQIFYHADEAMKYLERNRAPLAEREKGRFKGKNWYAFGYPKSMTLFQEPKIIVPDYNNVPSFTFDSKRHFYKTGYGIIIKDESLSPLYILGLLNSPLLFRYLVSIGTSLRGGYVRFWTQFLEKLPVRVINFSDPKDRDRHDRMVKLVEQMLTLHKQSPMANTPDEKTRLQRQIDTTDQQIDKLVYELYGLTEKEIQIVEENTGSGMK